MDYYIYRLLFINSMRDAVRQGAYTGEGVNPKKRLESDELLNALKPSIDPLVNNVLLNNITSQDAYDESFLRTTISVCDIVNQNPENHFMFGNAQKLINMILKYFYITTYNDEENREGFQYCHCPMDQQLLEKVWINRARLHVPGDLGSRSDFLKSWGKEDYSGVAEERTFPVRYIRFQTAVKELANLTIVNGHRLNPLEYDYYIWGT